MVQRKVYFIEPMIVAIVRPMLDEKDELFYRELGLKMVDFFQKLQTLRSLDTMESVSILDSCLYFDWQDMLTLFVESNNESFNRHHTAFLKSSDRANLDLKNRSYEDSDRHMLMVVPRILLEATNKQNAFEKRVEFDTHDLIVFTSKYCCWRNIEYGASSELVVGFSPEQFIAGEETLLSPPYKKILLGFSNE